jgi:hypothetical protein
MSQHHASAHSPQACTSAADWLGAARNSIAAAERCLSDGSGDWTERSTASATEEYLLDPALRAGRREDKWPGRCDDDLAANATLRPPRRALLFHWEPLGPGCDSLRKGRSQLPELSALSCAFCRAWAGRRVLFVGDSVQGAMFHSLAHILGVRQRAAPTRGANRECQAWSEGSGYEADVTALLCPDSGLAPVRARFIRNECLWLDANRNAQGRQKGTHLHLPTRILCDWGAAAAEADLVVLNRGYHSTSEESSVLKQELTETFRQLGALLEAAHPPHDAHVKGHLEGHGATLPHGGSAATAVRKAWPARVIYRGTHASLYRCATYPDPLRDLAHATKLHRSNANAWYGWRNVYGQHRLQQDLARNHSVTYLNTYLATSLRPGGRLTPNDCLHFCLPGPPDSWVRNLLALVT